MAWGGALRTGTVSGPLGLAAASTPRPSGWNGWPRSSLCFVNVHACTCVCACAHTHTHTHTNAEAAELGRSEWEEARQVKSNPGGSCFHKNLFFKIQKPEPGQSRPLGLFSGLKTQKQALDPTAKSFDPFADLPPTSPDEIAKPSDTLELCTGEKQASSGGWTQGQGPSPPRHPPF